jgi:hypothetical protein
MMAPASISACEDAWLEDFSIAKYRPMQRLLSENDYEFLAAQAGFDAKIAKRLRSERRKIFRAYLRNMTLDFHRLHLAAKMLAAYGTEDRSELASKLVTQRFQFFGALALVQVRLAFHSVGIGTVEVHNLIGSLESLRSSVTQLAPAHQTSA